MTALDADEEDGLPRGSRLADGGRGSRENHCARVGVNQRVDRVELQQRLRVRALAGKEHRGDEDRQELGVEPALAHPRDVGLAVRQSLREVGSLGDEALRHVVVCVDDDGVAVQRFGGVGRQGDRSTWGRPGGLGSGAGDGHDESRGGEELA